MMHRLRALLKSNVIKTLRFNFHFFPWRTALKLPVLCYGRVRFRSMKGSVEFVGSVYTGMVRIGVRKQYVDTAVAETQWILNGKIVFAGQATFFRGSYVLVADGAELWLGGKGTIIGSNTKIFCFEQITIGSDVRITWECQVYDTSFHYLERPGEETSIKPLTSPVLIGDRVWVGNRTTISKGAVIPDDTVVASNSLVNHDFSDLAPFSMIAGVPAAYKATGFHRVWDKKRECELDQAFHYPRTKL